MAAVPFSLQTVVQSAEAKRMGRDYDGMLFTTIHLQSHQLEQVVQQLPVHSGALHRRHLTAGLV